MPGFYAHHRFGKAALTHLPPDLRAVCENNRAQFDIGLQGPDLFFFYKPLSANRVVKYGHHLHKISAYPFFEHALSVIERTGVDSGAYAYLLGFICHFILDSQCHGYVNEMVTEIGASHLEIEEEFEKHLLRADGAHPLAFPIYDLVPQDQETAEAIALFYEGITPKIAERALADLRRVKRFFTAPGVLKQNFINGGMRLSGKHYSSLKGLMNQRKDNPKCVQTSEALFELFSEAVPLAAAMMESFDDSLRTGKQLAKRFDRNFE